MRRGDYWFQVAEQRGEILAFDYAFMRAKGRTHPGPICGLGDLYLKESVRGQGLGWRLYETRNETLRQLGVKMWEGATSAYNLRALESFRFDTWGRTLRRPLRESPPVSRLSPRRVKDLEPDWAGIWRLLPPSVIDSEAETKARIEASRAKRGAGFVAGPEPAGVIIGRISVNPWLFVERVGVVTDLETGEDGELSDELLSRLEQWMISKRATHIETMPLRQGEDDAWLDAGFEPYFIWRQGGLYQGGL